MTNLNDADIEQLLLDRFDGPVPDDGFCESAMQRLPARRRYYAWPLALGIVAGGVLCWLSLISAPLLRIGWRDWLSGELSAPALILLLVMASISLLTLVWTMAEADDRPGEF